MQRMFNNILDIFHESLTKIYFAGNMFQIKIDNPNFVYWKSSNQIDDCTTCRAIQMGDIIILGINDSPLEFGIDALGAFYKFTDIYSIFVSHGTDYFRHENCRCNFVPKID